MNWPKSLQIVGKYNSIPKDAGEDILLMQNLYSQDFSFKTGVTMKDAV